MLEIGKIYEIDSVLTDTEYEEVYKNFELVDWKFIAGELSSREQGIPIRKFWYKELRNNIFIHDLFKIKIESILETKIKINRMYGNGQAHGQSAWVHTDDSENDGKTYGSLVYYLHKNWLPIYGGHLMFVDDTGSNVIKSVFPKENTAVMFNAKMPHMSLEPSVYCLDQRVSIAVKFQIEG